MALTKRIEIDRKEGEIYAHKVAAGAKIYMGALVMLNAGGYLVPAGAVAGSHFAGVAVETMDNTGGVDGAVICRVYPRGNVKLNGSGFSQANVGSYASCVDDASVSVGLTTGKVVAGVIIDCESATQVWVCLQPYTAVA